MKNDCRDCVHRGEVVTGVSVGCTHPTLSRDGYHWDVATNPRVPCARFEERPKLDAVKMALVHIEEEMRSAVAKHGEYHSLHEAYGVLAEEVDELWDIVRQKRDKRDPDAIYDECKQIAAVALKVMASSLTGRAP